MTTEELNFSKICRVCCLEGRVMSIFKVHISRKLMACTSVQVWRNDGLPSQICTRCVSKLHIAFQFKKLCEKSDVRLRHHLKLITKIQENEANEQQQQQQQHQQQQQQLQQQANQCQNNYVYVECPQTAEGVQEIRTFDNLVTPISATQPVQQLDYSNSLNQLQQLPNSYTIQPTTVHFQAYNVPIQMPVTNQIITPIGQLAAVPVSIPLQPIISNHNVSSITIDQLPQQRMEKPQLQPLQHINKDELATTNTQCHSKGLSKQKTQGESLEICPTCGKEFVNALKLSRHMKIHSNVMPYRCKTCHKGFSHSGNLKVHMRVHNDERPFQCTMCDRACRQLQDLEKHIRTHTGEKPHICKVCEKGFSTSSNLIAHMRIHTGEKPYVCSVCTKAFCQSNELTKHTRTHTGEKTHICKLCNRGFNGSSTLVVHMRTHTGEKPYICSICNKCFTQSSCLQVHMKRHSGSKGINCKICFKDFVSVDEFTDHSRIHLKVECHLCLDKFVSEKELNKHIKVHET